MMEYYVLYGHIYVFQLKSSIKKSNLQITFLSITYAKFKILKIINIRNKYKVTERGSDVFSKTENVRQIPAATACNRSS